jgi:hypothetical protein
MLIKKIDISFTMIIHCFGNGSVVRKWMGGKSHPAAGTRLDKKEGRL